MPEGEAESIAQQQLMAIAEHHPEKVKKKNRGVLKMSKKQLHGFAATEHMGLPEKKSGWLSNHKSRRKK